MEKNSRGRPRQYPDNATRQAAYRARKAAGRPTRKPGRPPRVTPGFVTVPTQRAEEQARVTREHLPIRGATTPAIEAVIEDISSFSRETEDTRSLKR